MLSYLQYKPSDSLASYIECYWIYQAPFRSMSPVERLIPGGRTELILNLGHPIQFLAQDDLSEGKVIRHMCVMGQRSQIYYAKQSGDTYLIGVRFKPGGISAFTKMPAATLLNQIISAEEVFSTSIKEWEDRLREKKNDSERIYLLDQLMRQAVKGTPAEWIDCDKAVTMIRKSNPVSIHVLCNTNESYYKKLERDFLKYVGYTPKYYYRIVRFNKAIRQMQVNKKSLTSISYDCDYYDQSHFIKDFRQFAGTTPRHFLSESHTIADFLIQQQSV